MFIAHDKKPIENLIERVAHGSLEGPEHGVYLRGTVSVELWARDLETYVSYPDYWSTLADWEDATIQVSSHNPRYPAAAKNRTADGFTISLYRSSCTAYADDNDTIQVDYHVIASRRNTPLIVEPDSSSR